MQKKLRMGSFMCSLSDVVPGAGLEPARLAAGDFEIESPD